MACVGSVPFDMTRLGLRAHSAQTGDQPDNKGMLRIRIGEKTLRVELLDNSSAAALRALLHDRPLTIPIQHYGGFEKVGTLPQCLPRHDAQLTAFAGDVMLYQGRFLVLFYGTNSWAYTKLGTVIGLSHEELRDLLQGSETSATLSVTASSPRD